MPFIAVQDGKKVIPEEVDDQVDVYCPACKNRMRTRGPTDDGKARHFFHIGNIGSDSTRGGCVGGGEGESDIHRKYKSFAVSRMKQLYQEHVGSCEPEKEIQHHDFPSGKDRRIADCLLILDTPSGIFGKGIAVEVQYRNVEKDIEQTEQDYLAGGFSTLWLDESHFTEDRCIIDERFVRENTVTCWPNAVPMAVEWWEPDPLLRVKSEVLRDSFFRYPGKVPASLPREMFDSIAQDIYRDQEWDSLFSPPHDYTDIWCYAKVQATLPSEWHERRAREFWENEPWDARFATQSILGTQYVNDAPVEVCVEFSQFVGSGDVAQEYDFVNSVYDAWRSGNTSRKGDGSVERPSSPFDDVQCRVCETYWHISERYSTCPACGNDVDFGWNIRTHRISNESYERYYH